MSSDVPSSDREAASSASCCPVCKAEVASGATSFPFCSPRCRKIDLGRWMDERYVVSRPIEQADLDALD
ncbi:MAG: DNA gyrase inhibitor YacG [Planctomycetota bacterium]